MEMDQIDSETKEFFNVLETYDPTIPDELIQYYLNKSGFHSKDIRLIRLIGLSGYKFISDIAHDSMQYHRIRQQGKKETIALNKTTLTMDDLTDSLKEYGINIKKPEYYSDTSLINQEMIINEKNKETES